ncbi:had-superfamily subfamily variant 1 [Colletotrichum karsti]|uniref:Had-superfamily subfamily variant 1 n=1 Tax=Colletotrichum karsti TaxID=1095194 RepID=A0A9P6HWY2_9PEZI|nr:had-superfamily subfamily variant 1 [Colletotrichum karsti]KAF9873008.1 had-superfamily subfamily variant 1 [Colletotrichum karsti]
MTSSQNGVPAVLFDLDNTIFDHYHSLKTAISSIQKNFDGIAQYTTQDLISKYNASLQKAYDEYLSKEISYEEADLKKVRLFFGEIGLPEPDHEQIIEFRNIYKPAYRGSRRATPGSVEILVRLREQGYRLAIVTNGQVKDQLEKLDAIGVRHLVDTIITSEEAGCRKPETHIFHLALQALGASIQKSYVVGDDVESDIKGGIDAGLNTILYSPLSRDSTRELYGRTVPVVQSMAQLPGHLSFSLPRFAPRIYLQDSKVIAEGIGMDVVTGRRHYLSLTKETVRLLASQLAYIFRDISENDYVSAISRVETMIRVTAKAASPIDETAIQISYTGQIQSSVTENIDLAMVSTERPHSIRVEYNKQIFASDSSTRSQLRECFELVQEYCDNLMRDHPKAALSNLRSVMFILGGFAGIRNSVVVECDGIDLERS